jgi:hypothetical protein
MLRMKNEFKLCFLVELTGFSLWGKSVPGRGLHSGNMNVGVYRVPETQLSSMLLFQLYWSNRYNKKIILIGTVKKEAKESLR